AVVAAAEKQMKKLWHTTNIYLHPKIHEYAAQLVAKFPGNLKVVYFTNSGSEANDLAVLMARMYTGVYDCISLRNGYHGASPYLMGVTALSTWRYNNPTGFGFQQAMNPDPYRGPWGGKHCRDSPAQPGRQCDCPQGQCKACDMYVDQLEDVLRYSMPKGRVGAFIAEAIQGVGGAVQLPDGYLKKAYEKIRANGGVCIADEVQTGFGRMGSHYWGFESQGVMPDIVTMAKGIGNGFPMGAVVTTPEIAATMGKALHFNTFGGNPVASAVGQAVLEVSYASRTPLPAEEVASIWEDTKNMGVLIGKGGLFGNCFRIKPPMCITRADVDFSIAVMRAALSEILITYYTFVPIEQKFCISKT
uniref:Alanine--glyoxylate aminotransferase 2, mitochondrial n=1 Tax=Biomphalaria glabrata TaxID=6526 RepID=A0A2C9JL81_BIOGL